MYVIFAIPLKLCIMFYNIYFYYNTKGERIVLDWLSRTRILIGDSGINKLSKSTVAVFGLGGVGSFTAEALARSGVGHLVLFDGDVIEYSNINRQLIATVDNIGLNKADVAKDRLSKINPEAIIEPNSCFYTKDNAMDFSFKNYDYIVDAIDMVSAKIEIITRASREKVPIISSMGTGNKLDPLKFEVDDIYNTSLCPLARVMRNELRKRDIESLKVVYSKEKPCSTDSFKSGNIDNGSRRKSIAGSVSFVPSVAGLIIAGEVIKDIVNK